MPRSGPPGGGPGSSCGGSLTGLPGRCPASASRSRWSSVRASFPARWKAAESEPGRYAHLEDVAAVGELLIDERDRCSVRDRIRGGLGKAARPDLRRLQPLDRDGDAVGPEHVDLRVVLPPERETSLRPCGCLVLVHPGLDRRDARAAVVRVAVAEVVADDAAELVEGARARPRSTCSSPPRSRRRRSRGRLRATCPRRRVRTSAAPRLRASRGADGLRTPPGRGPPRPAPHPTRSSSPSS